MRARVERRRARFAGKAGKASEACVVVGDFWVGFGTVIPLSAKWKR
jgi:hypothetical protein